MGGTKVNYTPPPPDDTFSKYFTQQQESEKNLAARAEEERKKAAATEASRNLSGSSSYAALKATTQQQLAQGLIKYDAAANQLRDYATKYNLAPPEADINELTQQYTSGLPAKRATGITAAYEEYLDRTPTAAEISKAQERFQQGYYESMDDFKKSLTNSQEYQKKFNQSYLANYYDTQYGSQTTDAKGEKTGKRVFNLDPKLLPSYNEDLAARTKVSTPDLGGGVTGTPAEIAMYEENVRDTRQFLYSAGLTNLQGEIDKETQSLKNEGSKQVAKIGAAGGLYSNLVSGFWS